MIRSLSRSMWRIWPNLSAPLNRSPFHADEPLRRRYRGQTTGRFGRRPDELGIGHARTVGLIGNLRSPVLKAIGHDRPAIVASAFENIEFVPAAQAVLAGPDAPIQRMTGQTLDIAMTEGPDFRFRARLIDEQLSEVAYRRPSTAAPCLQCVPRFCA